MENSLIPILPPIVLGFGGVIPLLFTASPFQIPERLRGLSSVCGVLAIWTIYAISLLFWQNSPVGDRLVTIWLAVALLAFCIVLVLAFTWPASTNAGQETMPDKFGGEEGDDSAKRWWLGKWLPSSKRVISALCVASYIAGITATAIASSGYVASSNWITIHVFRKRTPTAPLQSFRTAEGFILTSVYTTGPHGGTPQYIPLRGAQSSATHTQMEVYLWKEQYNSKDFSKLILVFMKDKETFSHEGLKANAQEIPDALRSKSFTMEVEP